MKHNKVSLFFSILRVLTVFSILFLAFQRVERDGVFLPEKKESEEKAEVSLISSSSSNSQTAWVTYLSGSDENYIKGALSLYGSLRRHLLGSFSDTFVVVVVCSKLQAAAEESFSHLNISVHHYCEEFREDTYQNSVVNWSYLRKLHVLRLKSAFHRIIYMDTDINFLSDPTILKTYTRKPGFYAVTSQTDNDRFNSGVFVVSGRFDFNFIDAELSAAIDCQTNCSIYVDKLSKKFGDQGFLNVIYSSLWKPLPDILNVKAIFYLKGYFWGRKKGVLVRKNTVGLHWIGPNKPWHVDMLFPCGNTKKYCTCSKKESVILQKMHMEWWQNYYYALELCAGISKVPNLDSKRILENFDSSQLEARRNMHLIAKKRHCVVSSGANIS